MPHVGKEREEFLAKHKQKATEEGDWNYLFTKAFIKVFGRTTKYKTIHLMRKSIHTPSIIPEVQEVDALLAILNVSSLDRQVAREAAYDEFYAEIGHPYEVQKGVENGNVYAALKEKLFGSTILLRNDMNLKGE